MSKQKAGFSSSAGFQSEASRSGFSATLKKDSWGKQDPQLAATFKDPVLGKVAANVQQSQDRKRLIQNFLGNGFPIRLDQNAEVEDLDLKTTVNLPKPRPQTALPPRRDDPFEVKTFSKTQNLLIDDEPNRKFNPPGVLQMRNITYGGIFKKVVTIKKDAIVMIQSLVRGVLQRKKYKLLKKQYLFTLQEHRRFTAGERLSEPTRLQRSLPKRRPSTGSTSSSIKTQSSAFIKPILKSDGLGIWQTMHRKQTGKRLSTQSLEDAQDYDVKPIVQLKAQPQVVKPATKPPLSFWQKPKDEPQRLDKSKSSIAEEVYLDEEFEEPISEEGAIQEELIQESMRSIQESGIKESISIGKDSVIKESISGVRESISVVRESISIVKESISNVKESIMEEYADDFEEASYQPPPQRRNLPQSQDIEEEYVEEEFESYSEQKSDIHQKKKSVTFDGSVQQSRAQSPEPKPQSQPQQQLETQPIQYIKPKWEVTEEHHQVIARKEAEFILGKFRNRYRELRKLELDETAFGELEKEHYDFLKVRRDVDRLLDGTGKLRNQWAPSKVLPNTGGYHINLDVRQADLLFSKFQFEFHRLLSVNTLGSKLQNIIGSIGLFGNQAAKGPSGSSNEIPLGSIQRVLVSIEQQQLVVSQVLQQVMAQLNSLFVEQQAISEIRLYRQEMDQKLQQLLFKQDKLLNDRLESQLQKRDEELKRFIRSLFERQRKDFGSVKLMPSSKLQEALHKSLSQIQQPFQSVQFDTSIGKEQSALRKDSQKDDSSYQPDFEEPSEASQRLKSDHTESEGHLQHQKSKELFENSMSVDLEVNEYESFREIDWQNDINLFDKQLQSLLRIDGSKPDEAIKDRQTQEIVDKLTQMLLDEIKKDMFPQRQEPQKPAEAAVTVTPAKQKPKTETKPEKSSQPVKPEPPKLAQPQKEAVDDFGMGGPSFSRSELEQEFDLTGDVPEKADEKLEEKAKKVDLKVDLAYQKFVAEIVERYAKSLTAKKQTILNRLLDLIEDSQDNSQSLGGLMARDFRFHREQEVREKDGLPIVQALEEQLGAQLLRIRNEYTTLLDREKMEQFLSVRFPEALTGAKASVVKITEKLIPAECYPSDRKFEFEGALAYARRNPVPKECQQNYETQDHQIQEEMDTIGEEYHDKILMAILQEVMQEFNSIGGKRRQQK